VSTIPGIESGFMPIVTFIVNRGRAGTRVRNACHAAAERTGYKPDIVLTESGPEGVAAAERAASAGSDLVVAVGGDGTVRGCAEALAGTGVPLGIVPLGTANLLARALALPRDPASALNVAFTGRDRPIDLATADDVTFTAMAGIGIDAAVVAAARFKRHLGWHAYALAGVAHLRMAPTTFSIRIDDGPPITTTARSVVVANSGLLPGGFTILANCHPDDGVLDVGVLAPRGPLGWAALAGRVMRGDGRLRRFPARRVAITASEPLPVQADGEVLPGTPARTLTVAIRPESLLVRVPRS
jgi:diacylglycerol kinase family enzyme